MSRLKDLHSCPIFEEGYLIDVSGFHIDGTQATRQPEKVLCVSIILRAVVDVVKGEDKSRTYLMADYWIKTTKDSDEPFTFGWCCQQVSSDGQALANKIVKIIDEELKPMENLKIEVKNLLAWREGRAMAWDDLFFSLCHVSNNEQLQTLAHAQPTKVRAFKMWRKAIREEEFFREYMDYMYKPRFRSMTRNRVSTI